MKVCCFNPIPGWGGGGGCICLPVRIFIIESETTIDFSQTFLTFNFYGQLKHDIRSLRYVFRCIVERR